MTHKTQMQMALQRKMNNLNLKQTMSQAGLAAQAEGDCSLGLLAEGIAVRGQQNASGHGGGASTTTAAATTAGGGGTGAALGGNHAGGKRLQLVLPNNASEYAVRMRTPVNHQQQQQQQQHGGGHLEPSPLSSPLSASYSPLLPTSGFSSPLVHPKYAASGGSSDTPQGSEGTQGTPPTRLPSTSGSFIFEYYNGAGCGIAPDALLLHEEEELGEERDGSVRTSESCSPHVRLCGSRASCGPMWTNEELTMLAMDTTRRRPSGTSDSSSGTASGKGTAASVGDAAAGMGAGFAQAAKAAVRKLTDGEGIKGVSIGGGGGGGGGAGAGVDKASAAKKSLWVEGSSAADPALHAHPPTA